MYNLKLDLWVAKSKTSIKYGKITYSRGLQKGSVLFVNLVRDGSKIVKSRMRYSVFKNEKN